MSRASAKLRSLLERPEPLSIPFAYDAFSALLIEEAGFEACGISGSGVAASLLGMPDVGLLTQTELVATARRVVEVLDVPVLVDADTGYGGPAGAVRTLHELETAGAAGMIIEDQQMPKRCGHLSGISLISIDEMTNKIKTVIGERRDDLVIVARTDAIGAEDLDSAIKRANAYLKAGADLAFVSAPESEAQLLRLPMEISGPLLVVVSEGGRTPFLSRDQLAEFGYRMIGYSGTAIGAAADATRRALKTLKSDGTTASLHDAIMPLPERNRILRLDRYEALDSD